MAATRGTKAKETTGRKRQDEVKARQSLARNSSLNAILTSDSPPIALADSRILARWITHQHER
jgi:hypothetical protein